MADISSSKLLHIDTGILNAKDACIAIARTEWNAEIVDELEKGCIAKLQHYSVKKIISFTVPGAFEIPIVVREKARQGNVDAIVALGVILQGETAHAQHLGQVVTQALQQISLEHGVPVIHAVLSLKNEEQARKRCLEDEINRGTEAARAAVEMANLLAKLRK